MGEENSKNTSRRKREKGFARVQKIISISFLLPDIQYPTMGLNSRHVFTQKIKYIIIQEIFKWISEISFQWLALICLKLFNELLIWHHIKGASHYILLLTCFCYSPLPYPIIHSFIFPPPTSLTVTGPSSPSSHSLVIPPISPNNTHPRLFLSCRCCQMQRGSHHVARRQGVVVWSVWSCIWCSYVDALSNHDKTFIHDSPKFH